jgi:glutathione S-transferase
MWQCEEMGLPYQVEIESYPISAAYRALHPLGTVPFLEDSDGVAMCESVAMMWYIAQRYGPTPLLPAAHPAQLAQVLQLLEFGEATLGAGLNVLLAARFAAPEAERHNWSVARQEERIAQALDYLAALLGERDFVAGRDISLADISLIAMLGICRGVFAQRLPGNLPQYMERMSARAAYQRAWLRCQGQTPPAAAQPAERERT